MLKETLMSTVLFEAAWDLIMAVCDPENQPHQWIGNPEGFLNSLDDAIALWSERRDERGYIKED